MSCVFLWGVRNLARETKMKRRREADTTVSEIRSAIEELSLMALNVKPGTEVAAGATSKATGGGGGDDHHARIPLKPFLSLCSLLVQVLDKIGPTMAVLRQDIEQNIQRLDKFYETDPSTYSDVAEILKREVKENKAKTMPPTSCSKAFVWLTRSLDFTSTLFELLANDFDAQMLQAVEEAYIRTIKPWHGWISSAAYKVAIKLVPDSRTLVSILKAKDEDYDTLREEMHMMMSLLAPVLEKSHELMVTYGLDNVKAT